MFDVSRSVGRAIRDRVNLPPDLMGPIGHQAVNRAMLGGGIAGLGAQGINMVTGNPDGSDDINVLAAIAAGAGMGAASSKLGEMNRARMAREQLAQAGYMDAQFGMNQVMANDSPFGVPGMVATGPKPSPSVSEGFAPTMSAASNLPPLLKQALTPTANQGVRDAVPSGTAAISDLGVGASNVAKTQVPTEIPGGTEVFTAPVLGMGPQRAYNTAEEALQARLTREAVEKANAEGKKKVPVSQGTQLKSAERLAKVKSDKEMEGLIP